MQSNVRDETGSSIKLKRKKKIITKRKSTFGDKLKCIAIGFLKAVLLGGIIATQPIRWVLKLTIWPIIKLGRNIYCRVKLGNKNEDADEEKEEDAGKTSKSIGQKVLGVIKELGMFVGGYVFSVLRRIFISDICGLYYIAKNRSFFVICYCRMNNFCDGVGGYKNIVSPYCWRWDCHDGNNWGCSGDNEKFHFADYLRYVSGYSDVLNDGHYEADSIIRKIECRCLSKDSPEMYC